MFTSKPQFRVAKNIFNIGGEFIQVEGSEVLIIPVLPHFSLFIGQNYNNNDDDADNNNKNNNNNNNNNNFIKLIRMHLHLTTVLYNSTQLTIRSKCYTCVHCILVFLFGQV